MITTFVAFRHHEEGITVEQFKQSLSGTIGIGDSTLYSRYWSKYIDEHVLEWYMECDSDYYYYGNDDLVCSLYYRNISIREIVDLLILFAQRANESASIVVYDKNSNVLYSNTAGFIVEKRN